MKKIILTSFVAFSFLSSFGQFNKGRVLLGGSCSFSATTQKYKSGNTTTTTGKSISFSLAPRVGYFFMNNFAAGLGISLGTDTDKSETSTYKSTYRSFQVGPFVRYYLKPGIFFQGTYGLGTSKNTLSGTTTSETSSSVSSWSLAAGYAWFLNDHVAIEPMIGYSSTTDKTSGIKDISGGLAVTVGIQVYLGEK